MFPLFHIFEEGWHFFLEKDEEKNFVFTILFLKYPYIFQW